MRLSYNYHKSKRAPQFREKKIRLKRAGQSLYGVRRPPFVKRVMKKLFSAALVCIVLTPLLFFAMVAWYSRDLPDPNKLIDRALSVSTKIYDRTGSTLLYDIHGEKQRSLITIDQIPDNLKWATIVAEDKNFYSHKGFDLKGIFRSIVIDILRGKKAQGGSTITQQFIKNALLTSQKTFGRKIKELVLAYQLEKRFSKDQILQLYFNEIPYGSTAYGVQAAAMRYFGKSVNSLSLAESAIIAALPKAPTFYSPWGSNRDKLFSRQQAILNAMVEEGYVPEEEARLAKEEKIIFRDAGQSILAPHFVMYVKELLTEQFGEKLVEEGGLSVITTLDYEKQKIAEEAVTVGGKKNLLFGAKNASLVSLNARTGEILAMVGSRDYFDESIDGNVNVSTRPRQPGSSIKPIVYAAAFIKGYTPRTLVYDVATNFDTTNQKPYKPQNYTGKEYGPVTLKKALSGSLNIASVKVLYLTGVHTVLEFAKTLGYTTFQDPSRYGLSLVLGGGEVTLLDHTSAFTSFSQEGSRVPPIALVRVEDARGRMLFQQQPQSRSQVFDKEIARQITDILSDSAAREYVFGKNPYLTLPDRPVAIKTGTTNDFRDAWTIGYTPSVATGVWVGNNDNSAMKKGADGSKIAAPIWQEYMKRSLQGTTPELFITPLPIRTGKPILDGELTPKALVRIDATTGKLATVLTPPESVIEKPYTDIHSILYYIDKDNPQGEPPQEPSQDPQFEKWERAVQRWATAKGFGKKDIAQEPARASSPTGNTDHIITILSPTENDTITKNELLITIQTSSPQEISHVEYSLDNQLLESVSVAPYTLSYILSGVENGFHTLTAKSFDSQGVFQQASVTINILLQKNLPSLLWKSPTQGSLFSLSEQIPIRFEVILPSPLPLSSVQKVSTFYSLTTSLEKNIISTTTQPHTTNFDFLWSAPHPGAYTLTTQLTDSQHTLLSQKRVFITIQ
ncbi:PBP1A family penicillin-binding protein [Candidatus Uhrbacteria bacterium]|nr:PBP1A family penicillin-binding protein [Candidatus Uhrbacteria bacterium]